MQAGRPAQPSATNSPSSSHLVIQHGRSGRCDAPCMPCRRHAAARAPRRGCPAGSIDEPRGSAPRERAHGGGDHPVPFRTRQLSPPSPRVLRCRPWEARASRSRRALFHALDGTPPGMSPGAFVFWRRLPSLLEPVPRGAEHSMGSFKMLMIRVLKQARRGNPLAGLPRFGVLCWRTTMYSSLSQFLRSLRRLWNRSGIRDC